MENETGPARRIVRQLPIILWPPWSVILDAPRDTVEAAIEASIKMNIVYAADKTIKNEVSYYQIVSIMFEGEDPPICTIYVCSEGTTTRIGVDPPLGRTYGSFFEVLTVLLRLHQIVIPGTETEEQIIEKERQRKTKEEREAKLRTNLDALQSSTAPFLLDASFSEAPASEQSTPLTVRRRRGGKKVKDPSRRREIVDGWLKVQDYMKQDDYSDSVGISSSTLRAWIREFYNS